MSDFAEYVERQQAVRGAGAPSTAPVTSTTSATATTAATTPHDDALDDLDDILDALDLDEAAPRVPMRQLLLGDDDNAADTEALVSVIAHRIAEGSGEVVFDLGFEHSGDTLGLTREQWTKALARLEQAADAAGAECQVLLTRNVGGSLDVLVGADGVGDGSGSRDKDSKDKDNRDSKDTNTNISNAERRRTDCTGKVMIRRRPVKVEDVIETRIAVVGNGMEPLVLS